MEDVLELYQQPASPTRARLCFDERPGQLLDEMIQALPMQPGKAAKEDNDGPVRPVHSARHGGRPVSLRSRQWSTLYPDSPSAHQSRLRSVHALLGNSY